LRAKDTAELVEWYDKLSGSYDELYAREQSAKYELALEAVGASRFDTAVDVGCGSGLFFEKLGMICEFVVGIDLSREMLARARARARDGNVSLIRSDSCKLPLKDEIVDCLFAISLLETGGHLKEQVSEMARVVKEDGSIAGTLFRDDDGEAAIDWIGPQRVGNFRKVSSRETLFSGPARCFKNR
jgi:ubiquinone/menaquinone biosynthesis C-methylase UbiE